MSLLSNRARHLFFATAFAAASVQTGIQAAPQGLTVPAEYDGIEAPGLAFWAASPFKARRQLLIDAEHLRLARDRDISGIQLRRNMGARDTMTAGSVQLQVWLSHTTASANLPSPLFADNRGPSPSLVFAGRINLPASPPSPAAPAPWTPPYSVSVPFNTAFHYLGGTLCIETVTSPPPSTAPNPWWVADAVVEPAHGSVTLAGTSCIPGMPGQPASAQAALLVLGGNAMFFLRGARREGRAICALGSGNRQWGHLLLPLDLSPLGAPGCTLHNDIVYPEAASILPFPSGGTGRASCVFSIPRDSSLLGGSLFQQWIVFDPGVNSLQLTTSNGVEAVIGAPPTKLGMGWVENVDSAAQRGLVLPGRFPVLRFSLLP